MRCEHLVARLRDIVEDGGTGTGQLGSWDGTGWSPRGNGSFPTSVELFRNLSEDGVYQYVPADYQLWIKESEFTAFNKFLVFYFQFYY